MECREYARRVGLFLALIAAASIVAAETSHAQSNVDLLARFEGRYTGDIHRATTGILGGPAQNRDIGATTKEKQALQEPNKELLLIIDAALKEPQRYQHIPAQLLVLPATDWWTVELRHTDDQFGFPLPSGVVLTIPKALMPLSFVKVDGIPSESWKAQAIHNRGSLTIYLTEVDASSTPIQFQISLQEAGDNIDFVLWLIAKRGHQATSWRGKLARE
jgi:hypothetical protein